MAQGRWACPPPHSFIHTGPCIIAGSAWCLHEDLQLARTYFGKAPVIAVNGAAREIKALALFSQHPERFVEYGHEWIRKQSKFGDDFTVHASGEGDLPYVDHWWPQIRRCGGSAWGARKLATMLGFSPVVLCGCPMTTGLYVRGHGLGGLMMRPNVVDELWRQLESDVEWHEDCISMSGRTRELLGCLN